MVLVVAEEVGTGLAVQEEMGPVVQGDAEGMVPAEQEEMAGMASAHCMDTHNSMALSLLRPDWTGNNH